MHVNHCVPREADAEYQIAIVAARPLLAPRVTKCRCCIAQVRCSASVRIGDAAVLDAQSPVASPDVWGERIVTLQSEP
jgi:hypothetical protein